MKRSSVVWMAILSACAAALGTGCSETPESRGAGGGGGGGATKPAATVPAADAEGYRLVWSDEFSVDGPPNPAEWGFEQGFVRNQELQWYQEENARCEKGMLIIEARREKKPNPRYVAGSTAWQTNREFIEYTASSMNTRRSHSWLYGRFEMRAKIDTRKGSWPAFWTLGSSGGWPGGGEIDIMEYYNNTLLANIAWLRGAATQPATLPMTLPTIPAATQAASQPATGRGARRGGRGAGGGGNQPQWNTGRTALATFPKDWSEQFHVWRMDWDEASIKLYCDGKLLNSQDLTRTINPDGNNPFHHPQYIMLNQAIGGQGQDPSGTTFPVRFEVDYVRVYQKGAATSAPAGNR